MLVDDAAAHETFHITIALTVSPYSVSDQDASKLHELLAQLAPTVRKPYGPGAGPNQRPDILIQFVLEHMASRTIEALAGEGILLLMRRAVDLIRTLHQHPSSNEQQAPTTSIVLTYASETNHDVTISISTLALLPEQLAQVPDWLAALPNHLHQPPLVKHTVEHVTVPVGYFRVPTEYENTTDSDPLRYCRIQGPTIPNGIAVFDTHSRTLIDVWAEHKVAQQPKPSRPTVMSLFKRLRRSR